MSNYNHFLRFVFARECEWIRCGWAATMIFRHILFILSFHTFAIVKIELRWNKDDETLTLTRMEMGVKR